MNCSCGHRGVKSCVEGVSIFMHMTPSELDEIIEISMHKNFKKGDCVYTPGDTLDSLYVVHVGQIKISRLSDDGKEQVLRILSPGEFMGDLSLFAFVSAKDYAECLTDVTLCVINGKELKKKIEKFPSMAFKIMEELSNRLERVETLMEQINLYSVEKRLANFLLREANEVNEIDLKTTKQNIASQIGMSQETLSRKLTIFQENRWIKQIGHRKIILLNKQALLEIE